MAHLVLDRRVVGRKLVSGKLALEGVGTDGPQAHGQGSEKGTEDDENGLHSIRSHTTVELAFRTAPSAPHEPSSWR